MRRIGKVILWIGATGFTLGILGFIAAILIFNHYNQGLPSFEKLAAYNPPVTTRLYSSDSKLLEEYAIQKRIFVPFDAIPPHVWQAFLSAEDQSFFDHQGVDIFGILRAVRENLQNVGTGRSMVGGSTITQQVVKNFLLTNEKSLERKIKEAILAYRISKVYSKEKILELYLNEIFLGGGSYGVAAAAMDYFNAPLNELTTEQAALLAAMPKAPSAYNPRRNPERALQRRNYVINRMHEDGYISQAEQERASAMPLEVTDRDAHEMVDGAYFAEEVRRDLLERFGADTLYEGGLSVHTTLVPDMQKLADKALRDSLVNYDKRYGYRGPLAETGSNGDAAEKLNSWLQTNEPILINDQQAAIVTAVSDAQASLQLPDGTEGVIALAELKWAREDLAGRRLGPEIRKSGDVLSVGDIVIADPLEKGKFALAQVPEVNGAIVVQDVKSGRVLAMTGGYSYEKNEFNRATQAKRQPGSSFKPFVYLAALENGFTPSTIIMDEPVEIDQGPGKPLWRPKNYSGDFMGPTTLRVGLEKSRNTMTVRLAQMLGIGRIINVAKRFDIYEGDVPANYSMVLGAHEATLMRMVNAYAMIANGGLKVEPSLIERIHDRNGEVMYRADSRPCPGCRSGAEQSVQTAAAPVVDDTRERVADPRIAYQMISLLEGVATRGTAARAASIGHPVGGKTGTTNDSRDAWFIGFSPDYAVGLYVGYDTPKSLGPQETGGRVALPGFIEMMSGALKDQDPPVNFIKPGGIQIVQVDRATGLPPYPGDMQAKTIPEVFVVGEAIYKPPLPEGAEDERDLATYRQQDYEAFDPYEGWQDNRYELSPEEYRAIYPDGQVYRRNDGQGSYSTRDTSWQGDHSTRQVPAQNPGNAYPRGWNAMPPQQPQAPAQPHDGFNVDQGRGTAPAYPQQQENYGTGGMY